MCLYSQGCQWFITTERENDENNYTMLTTSLSSPRLTHSHTLSLSPSLLLPTRPLCQLHKPACEIDAKQLDSLQQTSRSSRQIAPDAASNTAVADAGSAADASQSVLLLQQLRKDIALLQQQVRGGSLQPPLATSRSPVSDTRAARPYFSQTNNREAHSQDGAVEHLNTVRLLWCLAVTPLPPGVCMAMRLTVRPTDVQAGRAALGGAGPERPGVEEAARPSQAAKAAPDNAREEPRSGMGIAYWRRTEGAAFLSRLHVLKGHHGPAHTPPPGRMRCGWPTSTPSSVGLAPACSLAGDAHVRFVLTSSHRTIAQLKDMLQLKKGVKDADVIREENVSDDEAPEQTVRAPAAGILHARCSVSRALDQA